MNITAFPHAARRLTNDELSRCDVHLFRSLKRLNHDVQLIGLPCFALALLYEFNPRVVVWIERPRYVTFDEDKVVELSFWLRYVDSTEEYVLVVPPSESEAAPNGKRRYRLTQQLMEVTQKLALRLVFVFQADITARAGEIATAFRLLPYVQTARTLVNRHSLRDAVCQVIASSPGIRLSQLQDALHAFHSADIQAIAADLIHDGTLDIDQSISLSRYVGLTLRGKP